MTLVRSESLLSRWVADNQKMVRGTVFPTTALMENRHGLVVQGDLTQADGHAERRAALDMVHRHSPGSTRQLTLGADKGYDAAKFVSDLREACVTPHVAQKSRYSAIPSANACIRLPGSGWAHDPTSGLRLVDQAPKAD